ncbi:hypothetical protein [Azospirillum sp.]|uniref:hypothetical protein n=1 Tax=Azospirillum sp. TaxID=34012 RepID=UPI003D756561
MAPPLPSPASLDDDTATAVQVLALAVQRERVPGIVEFSVASDALARAATSRNRTDLEYATVAFDSLDPSFRGRIVDRAYELARSERGRLRMPQIPQPGERLIEAKAALQDAETEGAGRARTRLMADLGRRPAKRPTELREEVELAPTLDEIVPLQPVRYDGPPPKWWE